MRKTEQEAAWHVTYGRVVFTRLRMNRRRYFSEHEVMIIYIRCSVNRGERADGKSFGFVACNIIPEEKILYMTVHYLLYI